MRNHILVAAMVLAAGPLLSVGLPVLAQSEPNKAATANQQEPGKIKQAMTQLMLTNESFVEKAATSNLAEVEASKLALRKSQNEQIKNFAQRMIADHTSASNQLKDVARSKQLAVPTELDSEHQKAIDKLDRLAGAEFDTAYSLQMQEDHDKAVTLFTAASDDDSLAPELKALARKVLPILRSHQADAARLGAHGGHTP
jgi:putative membrane protein